MFTLESIELDGTVYYCVSRELLWAMQDYMRSIPGLSLQRHCR